MTRPNVLLIVCDHWAAEHLGVAGSPAILTPASTRSHPAEFGTPMPMQSARSAYRPAEP